MDVKAVVMSGPSGAGKGTLIGKLMQDFPHTFGFSVSHTTRSPRPREIDEVHYHFTSRPVMEQAIKEGEFLESAEVHGHLYGTSWAAVEAVAASGKTCILDIDVQGARAVRKSASLKGATCIFIKPPAPEEEELEKRLRGRGTDTEEQIQQRLRRAKQELELAKDSTLFDHILVNFDLDQAYGDLKALLGLGVSTPASAYSTTSSPASTILSSASSSHEAPQEADHSTQKLQS